VAGGALEGERAPSGPVAGVDGARARERAIRAELRAWILEHAKAPPEGGELTDRTPLLETGLLSSLDVVELVLFIEELREAEVDTDAIEPEVFGSIDALWAGFFAESE
jgi:acyl carrier protein